MSRIFGVEVRELTDPLRPPIRFRCEEVEFTNEIRRTDGPDDKWESWEPTGNVTLVLKREVK